MDNRRPSISSYSPSSRSSTTRAPHRPQRPKKIVKSIWVKKGSTVESQAVLPQNVSIKRSAMITSKQTWNKTEGQIQKRSQGYAIIVKLFLFDHLIELKYCSNPTQSTVAFESTRLDNQSTVLTFRQRQNQPIGLTSSLDDGKWELIAFLSKSFWDRTQRYWHEHSTKILLLDYTLSPSMLEVVSALAAKKKEQGLSTNLRAASMQGKLKAQPIQVLLNSQSACLTSTYCFSTSTRFQEEIQHNHFLDDTADKMLAVTPGFGKENVMELKKYNIGGDPKTLKIEAGPQSPLRPIQVMDYEEQQQLLKFLLQPRPRVLSNYPGPILSQPQPAYQGTFPKDQGKGNMVEEPQKKKMTLQQIRALETTNDEEVARKIQA
ncbi:hypothetical protein Tco_0820341 [Tanacetum coccineum]|uniref:Uncharacterized protein n=1 Tax=Tanacetum coccineum TaxID=301880 RepID=A0ABQ5AC79_9ASTR